ncbi:hypothetical protein ACWGRX_19065, partial [Bosea sp. NPDC055594]
LKTLKGLTPYELICKRWTIEPETFKLNPIHQMPGLNDSGRQFNTLCPHGSLDYRLPAPELFIPR